ncbi:MAG: GntR family transcriptional regulator [Planctomycetota bacterium]
MDKRAILPVPRLNVSARRSFFRQIVDAIASAVAAGQYPPGSEFPSIPVMARHQGVSQKPVQQAYEYLVERGILLAHSGQGTRVHPRAMQNLRKLRTRGAEPVAREARSQAPCVAMLAPTVESSLHSRITRMIETRLYRNDVRLILGNYEENMARLKRYVKSFRDRDDCRAIILSPFRTDFPPPCLDALRSVEDRLLLLANRVPGLDCPCLTLNNEMGGRIGAMRLHGMGHRRILFLSGPTDNTCAVEREGGAIAFLRSVGAPEPTVVRGDYFEHLAYRHTVRLFRKAMPFTAVFCVNSLTCVGVLKALNDLKIRIPEDISLITFDDMDYPTGAPMTVIAQPLDAMAERVVDMIEHRRDRKGETILFEPELIERQSVSRAATESE